MNLTFNLEDIPAEFPYNDNYKKYYKDDKPGFNFAHKLRDFEEFTVSAQHFREFGVYTKHPFNRHKKSKYMQFWMEEKRRSIEGYNIGRDWIPGYYYWYLNYSRIEKVVYPDDAIDKIRRGEQVNGNRIEDFPDPWDYDYYWYHYLEEAEKEGHHGSLLKSRGKGYSYKGASMVNRNFFLIPKSKSYVIANESGYLEGGDGILARAYDQKEFVNNNTAFFKYSHEKNKVMHYKSSKIVRTAAGQELKLGYKSEVIGVSLKGDVGRARGKRGKLILWEESGNFPGLTEAWKIALESIQQDAVVYGLMVAFGTSGSEQRSFQNLKNMFLKPRAYNIKAVPNIWGVKAREEVTGMFCPSYSNINGYTDKDGNTDLIGANRMELARLEALRLDRAEPKVIIQHKMERPRHPEDALQKKGQNAFPVRALKEVLIELEEDSSIVQSHYVGRMVVKEGKPTFIEDPSIEPLRVFPHDPNDDNSGAIELMEKPKKVAGRVPADLYIAGSDPYDHDKSTTMSLGSTFIMNRLTGVVVAEYTGRPSTAEEYWEQTRLLLLYYNARINYENNLIGFRNHMIKKGSGHLLAETPSVLESIHKRSRNERPTGSPATPKINNYHRTLQADYLREKVTLEDETTYAQTLEFPALVQEYIDWDADGNYDRVSAMGMLLILYEDMLEMGIPSLRKDKEYTPDTDSFWDDTLYDDEIV